MSGNALRRVQDPTQASLERCTYRQMLSSHCSLTHTLRIGERRTLVVIHETRCMQCLCVSGTHANANQHREMRWNEESPKMTTMHMYRSSTVCLHAAIKVDWKTGRRAYILC